MFERAHALRVRAARGAAASTASASITSTACSIPATTCSGCRRARASCAPDRLRDDRPLYVVVEKILGADEDAAGLAGRRHHRLRLPGDGQRPVRRSPQRAGDERASTSGSRGCACRSARSPIAASSSCCGSAWPSELNVLAHRLNRFSERNRHYRDFTLNSLTQAMREIIACFPVYRTYVNDRETGQRARPRVHRARGARGEAAQSRTGPARGLRLRRATCCCKQADYIREASARRAHATSSASSSR